MNAYRKLAGLFAVALAATILSVGSALAQGIPSVEAAGKFTLPFEAHWGTATLPAGQYTFQAGRTEAGAEIVGVRGMAKGSPQAYISVTAHEPASSAGASELVCIRKGNSGTVGALVLTSLGETMYFSIPKNERVLAQTRDSKGRTLLAQAPELIQRISVEATGR